MSALVEVVLQLLLSALHSLGDMEGIPQVVLAKLGSKTVGSLVLGSKRILRPNKIQELFMAAIFDKFHANHNIRDHEVEVVLSKRSLVDLLTNEVFSLLNLKSTHLEVANPEVRLLHLVDDLTDTEVSVWFDEHEGPLQVLATRFLGVEGALGEVVGIVCDFELPRIDRHSVSKEQVYLADGGILGSLEEHPPVLDVVQVDRLVREVVLQEELLLEPCLLVVPLCDKDEALFSCHFELV